MIVARRGTRSTRASRGPGAARDTPLHAVIALGMGFALLVALAVGTVAIPALEDDPRDEEERRAADASAAPVAPADVPAPAP